MNFLLRLIVTAAICFGLAKVLPGVEVDNLWTALIFAVILAILNVIVKPILVILTLPVTILTLGLFLFIINALMVLIASKLVEGFTVDNVWYALLFALLLSLITSFVNKEMDRDAKRKKLI